jgi:acyl-CoA thioesterase II
VPDLWTDLLGCLQLRVQDGECSDAHDVSVYEGDLNALSAGPPCFEVWMRTPPVDENLAPALTAYATDLTLIGTALRPLKGFNHGGNGTLFTSAVTSHTIWFHRTFRTERWLLLRQHSPLLAHGRCFGRGDVLTEDGSLVTSYAPEALLRLRGAGDQVKA